MDRFIGINRSVLKDQVKTDEVKKQSIDLQRQEIDNDGKTKPRWSARG